MNLTTVSAIVTLGDDADVRATVTGKVYVVAADGHAVVHLDDPVGLIEQLTQALPREQVAS